MVPVHAIRDNSVRIPIRIPIHMPIRTLLPLHVFDQILNRADLQPPQPDFCA